MTLDPFRYARADVYYSFVPYVGHLEFMSPLSVPEGKFKTMVVRNLKRYMRELGASRVEIEKPRVKILGVDRPEFLTWKVLRTRVRHPMPLGRGKDIGRINDRALISALRGMNVGERGWFLHYGRWPAKMRVQREKLEGRIFRAAGAVGISVEYVWKLIDNDHDTPVAAVFCKRVA